jgi:outer membrane protein OmpA-like peptidoglycan-associated protein
MNMRVLISLMITWLATPGIAQDLPFPAPATVTDQVELPASTLAIATGPWTASAGTPRRSLNGDIRQTAYRLETTTLSTVEILAPLRSALLEQGFTPLYECAAITCGGFDFRYDLPVLPEPAMHVDLGDYLYFAATKQESAGRAVAIMLVVSRSANAGFVQVSRVGGATAAPATVLSTTSAPLLPSAPVIAPVTPADRVPGSTGRGALTDDIGTRLESGGSLALEDLVFSSGAASLAPGDYASLGAIAAYLAANPARQIAFVGHTDASGGLEANVALSRRRAESVRRALIDQFNVPAAQVTAQGVGYLAPRASNLTPEGRTTNRRVEVMLLNTE